MERFAQSTVPNVFEVSNKSSQRSIDRAIGDQLETRYCKRINNRQLIWLIVGMGLFAGKSYRQIFRLCATPATTVPIRATLTNARKRLSSVLLEQLCLAVVKLLAKSPDQHPFAFYKGLRLMGIDGTLLDCPDSDSNRQAFGRTSNQTFHGAFPKVRVVSLCELGTRVLWRSIIGTYHQSEQKLTLPLLDHLKGSMLLMADRNFGVAPIIYPLIKRRVPFLIRVRKSQLFPVEKALTGALDILHARLPEAKKSRPMTKKWLADLIGEIGREQLPPRACRINPRKLKKRSKAWPTKRDSDRNPPKPSGPFVDQIEMSI